MSRRVANSAGPRPVQPLAPGSASCRRPFRRSSARALACESSSAAAAAASPAPTPSPVPAGLPATAPTAGLPLGVLALLDSSAGAGQSGGCARQRQVAARVAAGLAPGDGTRRPRRSGPSACRAGTRQRTGGGDDGQARHRAELGRAHAGVQQRAAVQHPGHNLPSGGTRVGEPGGCSAAAGRKPRAAGAARPASVGAGSGSGRRQRRMPRPHPAALRGHATAEALPPAAGCPTRPYFPP